MIPLHVDYDEFCQADLMANQGYDADHADIDLLRLRNYTVGRKLTDEEVVAPDSLDRIAHLLTCMKPFVSSSPY